MDEQNPNTPFAPSPVGTIGSVASGEESQLPPTPPQTPEQPKRQLPIKLIFIILASLLVILGGGFAVFNLFLRGDKIPESVEVSWWGLWEDDSLVQPLIEKYQASHPNVKINYIKQSQKDYRQRLTSSLAKGTGPDIFRFHNTWVPMFKNDLAPIPASVMDSSTFEKIFYRVAKEDLSQGSRLVGIPLMFDGLGLYINEDIFQSRGIALPNSWEDLRTAALALTTRDDGQITQAGVALGTVSNVDHWQDILSLMFLQNRADLANPVGENAQDALEFYAIFAKSDRVWDETLPSSTLAFANGKLAMYFGPSWRVFEIKEINPELSFRILPVPQLPKLSPSDEDVTWASYWVEGVWQGSKVKEQAFEFLKFLSEREQLQALFAGQSKTRLFGELYPRVDMADLLSDDPVAGAYVSQAKNSRSWFLASNTFDGPTGINSRISKYFEDAINKVIDGEDPKDALEIVSQGVAQVLETYGVNK